MRRLGGTRVLGAAAGAALVVAALGAATAQNYSPSPAETGIDYLECALVAKYAGDAPLSNRAAAEACRAEVDAYMFSVGLSLGFPRFLTRTLLLRARVPVYLRTETILSRLDGEG